MGKTKLITMLSFVVLIFIFSFILFKINLAEKDSERSAPGSQASTKALMIEPDYNKVISPLYTDSSMFLSAIKQADSGKGSTTITSEIANEKISGLIVPHHLLAIDLAAKIYSLASSNKYKNIVLLSPDHFNLGHSDISVTENNFSTVFGEIKTDRAISLELKKLNFVSEEDFFYREHGLEAELPFIKYYWPDAEITALTFKPNTSKEELDQVIAVLEKGLSPDSLVIQSTDFSHYLTPLQAEEKDLGTIKVLQENSPASILKLNQPDNIDSLAAAYIQMSLQKDFYGANLDIIDHKNSQSYTKENVSSSTSYITGIYSKANIDGEANFIFVGDVMLSRHIGEIMAARHDFNFPFLEIQSYLHSADLVFGNLESPISSGGESAGHLYSFRADPEAVSGLKNAGFKVLSVANNHAFDYGQAAFMDTLNNLKNAGLAYAGGGFNFNEAHLGSLQEINGVKTIFLAYTNLLPSSQAATEKQAGYANLDLKQMVKDIKAAKEKADLVVVSFHWGKEYETTHNALQEEIAKTAIDAGASLIIGHHPHVVQDIGLYKGVTIAYSLGNFIFDQNFSSSTNTGLALKILIKDKKIEKVEPQVINFNHDFQPYLK